jgi:hypothetical protein
MQQPFSNTKPVVCTKVPCGCLGFTRVGNLLMATKISLTSALFDAGSERQLASSIGPKSKKGALPGVQVPLVLPLHVMSGNEGVSAAAAMEEATSRNVRMVIDSRVESMAAIGELILECREH